MLIQSKQADASKSLLFIALIEPNIDKKQKIMPNNRHVVLMAT